MESRLHPRNIPLTIVMYETQTLRATKWGWKGEATDGLGGKGCIYAGSEGCEEPGRKDKELDQRVGRRSLGWSSWSGKNYEIWMVRG